MITHYYVEQHPDFALGNFINCTPTMRYLAEKERCRIPVYFTKEYVKQCFLDCPFMEIIDEPRGRKLFSSKQVCPDNSLPDYQYIFQQVLGLQWSPYFINYHTYVDSPDGYSNRDYVLFINGSAIEDIKYVRKKNPGSAMYTFAKEQINRCVIFTGSKDDLKRMECSTYDIQVTGNMRKALALVRDAKYIISNDTGLAHAAGAMDKPILILWKSTQVMKNKNPGLHTQYSYEETDNWFDDIMEFIHKQEEILKG